VYLRGNSREPVLRFTEHPYNLCGAGVGFFSFRALLGAV
jgi:hypothetical protein